jgi:hypothetical protein
MNCRDFREVADSYLSDELLTETNHDMIRHMESCADCRGEIGARRDVRAKLRTAVLESKEYCLSENFDHNLMTNLRYEQHKSNPGSWFSMRTLIFAASLLLVGFLSFGVISSIRSTDNSRYLVSGFSEDSLINIAAGDHQFCAISQSLDELPVSFKNGDPAYIGLDKLVETKVAADLNDHKLIEAHSCQYKNVRFAHFVLKGKDDTLSVLVTPRRTGQTGNDPAISNKSSIDYRIASFEVGNNAIFILSDMDEAANQKVAEKLNTPFREYFREKNTIKTALLTFVGSSI